MRKIIFILSVLLVCTKLQAAHIVGGDMFYDYLGNNNYRITIIIYRDCASTGANYDNPMSVGVFDANNNLIRDLTINFPGSVVLPVVLNNPCVTPPSGICTERAIYTTVQNLPPSPGGYNVSYQRCCRGANVTNLNAPDETGLTLTTHIPGTNLNAVGNNSPRFDNYPPLVICNNDILNFDHSATDPDGDQLTYELITPYAGGSTMNPQPQPIPSPPYGPVQWVGGYSALTPLGPGATISINPLTGQLTADPELLGLFVVGIRVKEFRNGLLIGQSDRDFLFKVVNCAIQLKADMVEQTSLPGFESYCQGFHVDFKNGSFGGTNYYWDFGVDTLVTDISTAFEPSYTFPGPGEYQVMMIVNPGWPCTDTSFQTFKLYDNMDISFVVPDSICITGNSFDFHGIYSGPADPAFTWDFGPHSSIPGASTIDVNDIVFDTSGIISVSLSAQTGLCHGTFNDNVFIYNEPVVNFGIEAELKCAPYYAQFYDSSISYASLIYQWDFGDGTHSVLRNPTHLYETVGTFDVSLSIQSTEGCVADLFLSKPDLVQTFPRPVALFSADPMEATVFSPFFSLKDESFDSDFLEYRYSDSIVVFDRNPSLSFIESGHHTIYQIVENEFGCRDTSSLIVFVIPHTSLFIPNTFTPDGNLFNNVFQPVVYDVLEYELTIYDRWGEQLFHTTDTRAGWDGTYKNEMCPDGNYSYEVKIKDIQTKETIVKTGHINLIR